MDNLFNDLFGFDHIKCLSVHYIPCTCTGNVISYYVPVINTNIKAVVFTFSNNFLLLLLTISVIFFYFIFVFLQLGNEQANTKLFISNQINKFEDTLIDKVKAGRKGLQKYIHKITVNGIGSNSNRIETETVTPKIDTKLTELTVSKTEEKRVKSILRTPVSHKLTCQHADLVTFWKPTSVADMEYISPFAVTGLDKYVTFEPDVGGWNNIRMQMETVVVFAAATGRILVLPPDQPMYLLNAGRGHQKAHSFADFFPFDLINTRVPVITMQEFMAKEGVTGGLKKTSDNKVQYPPFNKTEFIGTLRDDRIQMWHYLRNVSSVPAWKCMKEFVVIPPRPGVNVTLLPDAANYLKKRDIFAAKRTPCYYDNYWQSQKVIHFVSMPGDGFRLLEHFYTFIYFEDDEMDRYYKRFVVSSHTVNVLFSCSL